MTRHSSYSTVNISRAFRAFVGLLFCGFLLKPAPAFAYITPDIKTIVVLASGVVPTETDSSTRRDMGKLLLTSPVLSEKNIEKIVTDYLTARLNGKVTVLLWRQGDPGKLPKGESTLMLRLDYSVWPQEINGKSLITGGIAVHIAHLLKDGFRCIDNNDNGFLPVDSFVVNDEPKQTQHNLEAAIARLLDGYGTIHERPSNE